MTSTLAISITPFDGNGSIDEGALRETRPDMIAEVIRRIQDVKNTITGEPIPVPLRATPAAAPVIEHAATWPPRHQKRKQPKGVPATEWGHMKHDQGENDGS